MTSLNVTQHEIRHRMLEADLERAHAVVTGHRVVEVPRSRRSPRRWFRAFRSAVAA